MTLDVISSWSSHGINRGLNELTVDPESVKVMYVSEGNLASTPTQTLCSFHRTADLIGVGVVTVTTTGHNIDSRLCLFFTFKTAIKRDT